MLCARRWMYVALVVLGGVGCYLVWEDVSRRPVEVHYFVHISPATVGASPSPDHGELVSGPHAASSRPGVLSAALIDWCEGLWKATSAGLPPEPTAVNQGARSLPEPIEGVWEAGPGPDGKRLRWVYRYGTHAIELHDRRVLVLNVADFAKYREKMKEIHTAIQSTTAAP